MGILVVTGTSRKVGIFHGSRTVATRFVSKFDTLGTMQANVLIVGTHFNPVFAMKTDKSFLANAMLKVLVGGLIQLNNMWSKV